MCKFFYMFLNIFCKMYFTKCLFPFQLDYFEVFYGLSVDHKA